MRRMGWVVFCCLFATVGGMTPTGAGGGVRLSERVLELPDGFKRSHDGRGAQGLWAWPAGGRLYALGGYESAPTVTTGGPTRGFSKSSAFDLDDLRPVAEASLERHVDDQVPAWFSHNASAPGNRHVLAVDDDGGRLFLAYSGATDGVGPAFFPGHATGHVRDAADDRQLPCGPQYSLTHPTGLRGSCFRGVLMVDAESLAPLGRMPFESTQVDGLSAAPVLRAMRYVPPTPGADGGEGLGGRVLVVLEDIVSDGNPDPVSAGFGTGAARYLHTVYHLAQFDPESRRMEWVVRLDTCRSPREHNAYRNWQAEMMLPNAAAVFRSVNPADRAVYVGCHGSSQAATVVRVPLDEDGFAWRAVRTGDPGMAEPGSAITSQTGPNRAVEVVADPGSGRVLFRVVENFTEVWWVFDTTRMEFIGTIGIGPIGDWDDVRTTVNGLDEQTGRLYVLSPPRPVQGFAGGLFIADIRRTPVPQARVYPEFAELAVTNTKTTPKSGGSLVVVAPPGGHGPRSVWVPQGVDRWVELLDHVPPR